ncbi:MAG: dinitrogenase iron-molybdenum cofactor biosynthesis protein [Spirochaetes bacterium]|nr:MAG: dinitrogenase iron-molybdenum cofactor biosynthesis protein [Spirochaetota bacterium]
MKIALPTHENMVDGHFGHCEYFTVFTVGEDRSIVSRENITPPPGCGCKSDIVHTLADMGVTLMLAGNMGQGAVNKLGSRGIRVLRGCAGDVQTVTEQWIAGSLTDSGVSCAEHGHGHECHEG